MKTFVFYLYLQHKVIVQAPPGDHGSARYAGRLGQERENVLQC